MLEAIVRSKMHHAMKADETFSYQLDKTQILMQNVIKNITKQNFDESEQSFDQFVEFHQLFWTLSWYGEFTFKYNWFSRNT